MNKTDAQRRADRIRAFREELEELERAGILSLGDEDLAALRGHHDETLRGLAERFDIDTTTAEKQLSWGMRIASLLAVLALGASVFFLFYRFWGVLGTPVQVLLLVLAPLLCVACAALVATREKTLYFTLLLAGLAFACFILDLSVMGAIFNVTPTQSAFLAWAAFALLLAYAWGLRLLQVAGIVCLGSWIPATVAVWGGCHWFHFGERPENFLAAGLVLFLLPVVVPHERWPGFPAVYRFFGLLWILVPVFALSNWGGGSYLTLPEEGIELLYELCGFLLAAAAVWIGIRMHWKETTNTGVVFFIFFLYARLWEWWWDWMPRYLFFFLLGAIAVGVLLAMRWFRGRARRELP